MGRVDLLAQLFEQWHAACGQTQGVAAAGHLQGQLAPMPDEALVMTTVGGSVMPFSFEWSFTSTTPN